ncbi:unnamed protein product [Protopolystoma xenopodis]|uniref:Uncharacterized protein n=1 Tax=Protopolystoma xenopodis TaxID=117903 RepID=A0A448WEQ3_9PLAT|nr:unnamed protein product [Protopolystoma xenopodis]
MMSAGILKDTDKTEVSIRAACTTGVVESATSIARRANRVIQVANREAENSEETGYVERMNCAVRDLRSSEFMISFSRQNHSSPATLCYFLPPPHLIFIHQLLMSPFFLTMTTQLLLKI